jgi:hypothetical protein
MSIGGGFGIGESLSRLSIRAKKNISSRISEIKFSRSMIFQFAGNDADFIANGIFDALKVFFGEEKAEYLEKAVCKCILKLKVLIEERVITDEILKEFEDPIAELVFQWMVQLNISDGLSNNSVPICRIWNRIVELAEIHFEKVMKKQNVELFADSFRELARTNFILFFLKNKDFVEIRKKLYSSLEFLVEHLHFFASSPNATCMSGNCTALSLRSFGLFRSCGYCAKHHSEYFKATFEDPQLYRFISDNRNSVFFVDFLKDFEQETKSDSYLKYYNFILASNEYMTTNGKQLRLRVALQIIKKFFLSDSSQYIGVDLDLQKEITQRIAEISESEIRLPTDLFSSIMESSYSELNAVFKNFFLTSNHYKRFVLTFTIPKSLVE